MSDAPMTNPVDISQEAVDNAASYLDEVCFPHSAAMLHALRAALTAAQADRAKLGEDAAFLDNALNALIKERDQAFVQVDELSASLTAEASRVAELEAQLAEARRG